MREMLNPTSAIAGMGLGSVALDYRRTFFRCIQRSIHRTCFSGSSSQKIDRLVEEGDIIKINIPEMTLNVDVSG